MIMKFILILFFTLFLFNCKHKTEQNTLVGEYVLNDGRNSDIVVMNDDYSYVHKMTNSQNLVFESRGKWELNSLGEEVRFEDFVFFNEQGADNPPGSWYSKVKRINGKLVLVYASEEGIYYVKTE